MFDHMCANYRIKFIVIKGQRLNLGFNKFDPGQGLGIVKGEIDAYKPFYIGPLALNVSEEVPRPAPHITDAIADNILHQLCITRGCIVAMLVHGRGVLVNLFIFLVCDIDDAFPEFREFDNTVAKGACRRPAEQG